MQLQIMALFWVAIGSLLGGLCHPVVAAQVELRPCGGSAPGAGNVSDCQTVFFGHSKPDPEVFYMSLVYDMDVVIAQYSTSFAIAYGPPTNQGLIALRYEAEPRTVASHSYSQPLLLNQPEETNGLTARR
ncbi:hypothetical protein IQ254_08720 [Nodosilinea sp. LEGE 07088]|uniref:hypothetical protein n=1 Tax=Nodosilinea sp. LEGE 07088 TaxID=2777968 RepID=UPI00187F391B|nr:hypothetical protein [Nodosilinea sp. LEGE 07088]MBE9137289.1 hypothetical protein [Nodosilinea sp. LEGE 07088]